MNVIVLLRMVPDVVEELAIGGDGKSLDTQWLRMKVSDPDEHAIEEAVILKEKYGGKVSVVVLDAPEVDDALFTALAKGADAATKLPGDWTSIQAPTTARLFASLFSSGKLQLASDTVILLGSQAIDDLEGEVAPYLAEILRLPFVGVVTGVRLDDGQKKAIVVKEFAGGLRGEFEVPLPAVFGIQSAEKPPRYVPIAKVRSMMKTAKVETADVSAAEVGAGISINKMFLPEAAGKAEMLEDSPDNTAARIVDILAERGLIRR